MTEKELNIKRLASRIWRENNRERHREYSRQYRRDHKKECYDKNRKWALENPEKVRGYHRDSRKNNPEQYKTTWTKWRKKNPAKIWELGANRRAMLRNLVGTVTKEEWIDLCGRFDNRCVRCLEEKPLTMDHVVPVSWGGRNQISNIQPLCKECNSHKGTKMIDYRFVNYWVN